MRRFLSIAVLFLSGLASIPAQAAIMVSVQNGNFVQGGGPQSLNVFARSTASDTLISTWLISRCLMAVSSPAIPIALVMPERVGMMLD